MAERHVSVWYDAEGDYLEVLFDRGEGFFRPTADDRVMEKVDDRGAMLGFSILGISSMRDMPPLQLAFLGGTGQTSGQ